MEFRTFFGGTLILAGVLQLLAMPGYFGLQPKLFSLFVGLLLILTGYLVIVRFKSIRVLFD